MGLAVRRIGVIVPLLVLLAAGACQEAGVNQLPPTPAPVPFVLLREALAAGSPLPQNSPTLAGYVLAQDGGSALVSELVFDADGAAHVPETAAAPVWLGTQAVSAPFQLRAAGALQYAPALAHGSLEGPGAYGPGGRYAYQLATPTLEAWVPVEVNIGGLLDDPQSHSSRLVRVVGGLLLRNGSALLVDTLGPGGIPAQSARQIKLLGPISAPPLLDTLAQSSSGAVRFGQVQIEGVLRGRQLVPLAISPVR